MNVQLRRLSALLPLPATENDADCSSSAALDIHALLFSFTVELPNLLGILIGLPPKPRDPETLRTVQAQACETTTVVFFWRCRLGNLTHAGDSSGPLANRNSVKKVTSRHNASDKP